MPTLEELQAADAAHGKAQLQTLLLEFSATLARVPNLQRELQSWLAQDALAVDYAALSARAESALVACADWLLDYDHLPTGIRQTQTMQDFMRTAGESATCRTVTGLVQKFRQIQEAASQEIEQHQKELAAQERQRQEEAEEKKRQTEEDQRKAEQQKSIEPEMVQVPAGAFTMGGDDSLASDYEKPLHQVNIKHFEIGKYPVTQGQWKAVMGSNPSHFSQSGDDCPVEQVSWYDAQEYIQKLNQMTGKNYRLPSEAEWEYACRAGGRHPYSGSDEAYLVAWFDQNSNKTTHPVGQKQPNAWGLYDMSGNVFEWVQDWIHNNYAGAPTDGSAWITGGKEMRVLRGGSWISSASYSRSANRDCYSPVIRGSYYGFRLARTAP
jgi:formylglycine-generating enzyme required for sulfatase activity